MGREGRLQRGERGERVDQDKTSSLSQESPDISPEKPSDTLIPKDSDIKISQSQKDPNSPDIPDNLKALHPDLAAVIQDSHKSLSDTGFLASASHVTREHVGAFLKELGQRGVVRDACRASGIPWRTAYCLRDRDPIFREMWDAALAISRDVLAREAWRRAVEGVIEPVVSKGEVVTYVRKHSDRLMEFLLERLDRKRFGPPIQKHAVEGLVVHVHGLPQLGEQDGRRAPIDVTGDVSEDTSDVER
jgi:hypothetical protein